MGDFVDYDVEMICDNPVTLKVEMVIPKHTSKYLSQDEVLLACMVIPCDYPFKFPLVH